MNTLFTFFLLFAMLFTSSQALAKKAHDKHKGPMVETPATLGSSLMLVGTSSAQTVDNILKGIESISKEMAHLSAEERNFLFGYANYRLGKWKEAEEFFKKCDEGTVPGDHLLLYRAKSELGLGHDEAAVSDLMSLLENHQGSVWTQEAKTTLAEALIRLKRFDEARHTLESYIKSSPSKQDTFEASHLFARSYLEQKDTEQATERLRHLILSVSDEIELSRLTDLAKEADKKLGTDIIHWMSDANTQYQIADSLAENLQWNDAIAHVDAALKGKGLSPDNRADAKWLLARAHFRAHHYKDVIPLLEEQLEGGGGGARLTLLQHLASAYARVDDYKHAIELRRKIMKEYASNSSVVLDSSAKIAFLLLDDGMYKEAIDAWEDVLRLPGGRALKSKATWYLAWSYYMQKDYAAAIERINNLLKDKASHKMEDRLLYWKARCLELLGKNNEARSLYSEILGDHPIGYYGVLSKRHLDGDEREFGNFGQVSLEKSSKTKYVTEYPPYEKVRPTSPHLSKAFFFDRLNLHEEAARELAAASGEKADTNLILALAARNFAHDIAFQIVYQRYASILHSTPASSGFENFVWEMSYPEAYKPVVERLAGKTLDPRLVYAIMRAESNFRLKVVSPAGAAGLMQLMPVTAQKMAMEIGNRGFDTRDLYRPSKNIEYGIEYLKKLDNLFPDNTVAIIASYNAGEEAVGRWLKHGYSNDVEEFIEEIPYDETNLYVKKVLMSYWILQRLYPR